MGVLGRVLAIVAMGWFMPLAGRSASAASQMGPSAGVEEAWVGETEVWAHLTVQRRDARSSSGHALLSDESSGVRPRDNRYVLHGRAVYRLRAPSGRARSLVLIDFAAANAEGPSHLDEARAANYQYGPWQASGTSIISIRSGRGQTLSHRREAGQGDIVVSIPAGVVSVEIRYQVRVPRRRWPFGCVRQRCSLSGALAPLPSRPHAGRVVDPVVWKLASLTVEDGPRKPKVTVVEPRLSVRRTHVDVYWGRFDHAYEFEHRGVAICIVHRRPRPRRHFPHERRFFLRRDVPGRLELLVRSAIEVAVRLGLPVEAERDFVVVQGSLGSHLARATPGGIQIAHEWLELPNWSLGRLLPAAKFQEFHELRAVQAIMESLVRRALVHTQASAAEQNWLSGLFADYLVRAWQWAGQRENGDVHQLLKNLQFLPSVDRFLYSGQSVHGDAYLGGIEMSRPLRNDPTWYGHHLPDGRRIFAKLVDMFGLEATSSMTHRLLGSVRQRGLAEPALEIERAMGRRLAWFFEQWLGEAPVVDYAIRRGRSKPAVGGGFVTEIDIIKEARQPVIEPVQWWLRERGGRRHRFVWSGELSPGSPLETRPLSGRHRVRVFSDHKIRAAGLDPHGRLQQRSLIPRRPWMRGDNSDPKFNDRDPRRVKLLFAGLGFNVAASEFIAAKSTAARLRAIAAMAAVAWSKRRDLARGWTFTLSSSRETLVAGSVSAFWAFSDRVTPARRRSALSFAASAAWLGRGGLDRVGGMRLSQAISLTDSSRRFKYRPERDQGFRLTLGSSQTLRDRHGKSQPDWRTQLQVSAGWSRLFRIAHGHVVAANLQFDLVLPLRGGPEFRSLLRGGGIGGLQAYTGNEIFGQGLAIGRLEYRHRILEHLNINLLSLGWVRDLRGAVFVGTASASRCENHNDWFGRESWYGEVGYGLSTLVQVFGLTNQFARLDVAIPLQRRVNRSCLGAPLSATMAEAQGISQAEVEGGVLPPFSINLTFTQPF